MSVWWVCLVTLFEGIVIIVSCHCYDSDMTLLYDTFKSVFCLGWAVIDFQIWAPANQSDALVLFACQRPKLTLSRLDIFWWEVFLLPRLFKFLLVSGISSCWLVEFPLNLAYCSFNLLTSLFSLFRIDLIAAFFYYSAGCRIICLLRHELKLPPPSTDWSYHFKMYGTFFQRDRGQTDLQRETDRELTRSDGEGKGGGQFQFMTDKEHSSPQKFERMAAPKENVEIDGEI